MVTRVSQDCVILVRWYQYRKLSEYIFFKVNFIRTEAHFCSKFKNNPASAEKTTSQIFS